MKTFIESQFPVSKVSKESYKERKANYSQTLTGLGKWWGRKPLILVRATILGLLLPATANPKKDREIFLKILTMDEEGLWLRKSKPIALKDLYSQLQPEEREQWFSEDSTPDKPKYKKGLKQEDKTHLQKLIFSRLSYDEKLEYCDRPEHIANLPPTTWQEINTYLGTMASNLPELIQELGKRQFGHIPRVGDAFCGGGSIPFEAARIGCEAYGSDLNPVAALLTWAALNIVGGGEEVAQQVKQAQQQVYDAVDKQITAWGIEHNASGGRSDAYLYCNETRCPECGWLVPLAPSWVIGEKTKTIALLEPDEINERFHILIKSGVSNTDLAGAKSKGTVKDSDLRCPHCGQSTPMQMIRGDRKETWGLRLWENTDLVPRPDDVFQERLYCIRWVETQEDESGKVQTHRYYRAPDEADLEREQRVLVLLQERFAQWQEQGYIPSRRIEPGDKTDEPVRTRGWTHWHHLFNPRQLLTLGLFGQESLKSRENEFLTTLLLEVGKLIDTKGLGCRILRWNAHSSKEMHASVFSNQALNTIFNYCHRTLKVIDIYEEKYSTIYEKSNIIPEDSRTLQFTCDLWITDPPYADAINYHELSEFFLAWYEKHLTKLFPDWYTDSKRALAITGRDDSFRKSMVDCYKNLAQNMPENGAQVVMFTHQDARVWADLALILWASGLRVTAAWCIATETDSALKKGNYVQGTVLLILRKQTSDTTAFLDELNFEIEEEVKKQLDSMLSLEDKEDPNFVDTDYQLAAYAAALRVLTQYKNIEDFDIAYELSKPRKKGDTSPIEKLIDDAVKIACDYLVPVGFDTFIWKTLTPVERFYLKGLDLESHGEYRSGAYQELARGFGLKDYQTLLAAVKANETRLKTPTEFANKSLNTDKDTGFSNSLVRNILFAIREAARTGEVKDGKNWLKTEIPDYWHYRKTIIEILKYLATMGIKLKDWQKDAEAARLVAGAVENDTV